MNTGSKASEKRRMINSVKTSFRIIEHLDTHEGAGVSELARKLGHSKSTIHNHLRTLNELGYVYREGNEYRPSLRFLDVSENLRENHLDVYRSSKEVLQELARDSEEYAWLMIEERGKGVFINSSRGSEAAVTTNLRLGKPYHLHGFSTGKAILSALPRDRVEDIVREHGLPQFTDRTITERAELFEALDQIAERGVAFSQGETTPGVKAVGAPIISPDGDVLGAVGISGPKSRMKGAWYEQEAPELVVNTANLVEIHTTYHSV